ncbi:hypothetical protein CTAYLR_005272 [Chrysophaeum taylorii]|uniref:EF-hand domain-containing protein n=1 Tax=Chrysophaeum taylorii TaxID=2483200 RepID=A0AAD7UJ46_9STRA|nr:hypothetical protein CTAYLR_005272 [Chrysophaeum taylorii]
MGTLFIDPDDLPNTALGDLQLLQLFLAYAYLLYIGCQLISDGAELLMLTPYSKLVGSCILPVLGAVPDGAIVLFSGLGPNAQSSLDIGVGALAGSTVMLVTIPWALAIYGGRVNLDDRGIPKYAVPRGMPRLSPPENYWNSGVTVASGYAVVLTMALWMLATATPYLIVEIGALVAEQKNGGITNQQDVDDDKAETLALEESPAALVALLVTVFWFVAYLCYQYRCAYGENTTTLEERQRAATVNTVNKAGVGLVAAIRPVLAAHSKRAPPVATLSFDAESVPLTGGGGAAASTPTEDAMLKSILTPFFRRYDVDKTGTLSISELGRVFADMNENKSATDLRSLFEEYDRDKSGQLSFEEFVLGMKKYVAAKDPNYSEAEEHKRRKSGKAAEKQPVVVASPMVAGKAGLIPEPEDDNEDEEEEEMPEEFAAQKFHSVDEQQRAIKRSALTKCVLGTAVVLCFSDPITDVLDEVGDRTGISAFYIGFVVAPLITNGSELLASYTFALKKTSKSMVVAYEQLLGAAIMNNTYCLAIFLMLIYAQNLYWNYTAEVLSIVFAEIVVFFIVTTFKVHTLKTAVAVLSLYPLTVVIVYVLENFVGLS